MTTPKIDKLQVTLRMGLHPLAEGADLEATLTTLATQYGLRWLLAWLDDGVVWGLFKEGQWHLSGTVAPQVSPPLRLVTLQELRAFGSSAEVRYTPTAVGWQATVIQEGVGAEQESYDERYLLWGTEGQRANDFTRLTEGRQGLVHLVPGTFTVPSRVALWVRHYLDYEEGKIAYVRYSRLVALTEMEVPNAET